jgi:hypothetical protein
MAATLKFTTIGSDVDLTSTTINVNAAPTSTPRQGGFTLRNRIDFSTVTNANKLLWVINDATLTNDAVKNFRILEVPERVFVKNIRVHAVKSETAPTFSFTGAKASNASLVKTDLASTVLYFGADSNKKPTSSASYAAATHLVHLVTAGSHDDGAGAAAAQVFGALGLGMVSTSTAASLNVIFDDAFDAVDASINSLAKPFRTVKAPTTLYASGLEEAPGEYFPYGGYVTMRMGPYNTSLSSGAGVTTAAGMYASATAATLYFAGVWEIQAEGYYVPE